MSSRASRISFVCRSMLLHIGAFGAVDEAMGPAGFKDALTEAFSRFTDWRRQHRIQSSQRRFNYKGIFNEVYGCYLNAKGFNARIITEWLLHEVIRARSQPGLLPDERLETTEKALTLGSRTILELRPRGIQGPSSVPHITRRVGLLKYVALLNLPRRGICRFFGLSERASRWLQLGPSMSAMRTMLSECCHGTRCGSLMCELGGTC